MGRKTNISAQSRIKQWILSVLLVVTAPLWITLFALLLLLALLKGIVLYALVWSWWIGWARRRVLFVYSDSPNWKAYIEASILPQLPRNTVVLNWSQRALWSRSDLSVRLFHGFAGDREFNPIGLVFERFRLVGEYRFWRPFRDAKHGNLVPLQVIERQFLEHANGAATNGVISLKG
jgi:hypothetical protein